MNCRLFYLVLLIIFSGCAKRNLVYFSDIDSQSNYNVKIETSVEPRIQQDDLLKITVSSLNQESNLLFNAGILTTTGNNNITTSPLNEGYLVDKSGEINFPVLGKIKIGGLTKDEAIEEMSFRLREHVKDPIVNIRFLNFKVTVIGEVNKPSTFTVPTEKITILEALGLAGDMTAYGKRENVLVIRDKDGVRSLNRLNLNDKGILSSPYYYLTQNDVVYVEPDKMKAVQTNVNPNRNQFITIASSIFVAIIINSRFLFD
ncbi:MAG TPA: polysaccharide biosynthesis/export family protein [Aequorivita sp.]|nr:polysaccharide biosynthesis/export family protein [Aequorivita sp.]